MARIDVLPEVTKFLEGSPKMTIAGQPVDAVSGTTFEVIDPSTGGVVTEVPRADVLAPAHAEQMVEALAELSEHATFTRLLGSYAAAVPARS